jgi:hypothetical protein
MNGVISPAYNENSYDFFKLDSRTGDNALDERRQSFSTRWMVYLVVKSLSRLAFYYLCAFGAHAVVFGSTAVYFDPMCRRDRVFFIARLFVFPLCSCVAVQSWAR